MPADDPRVDDLAQRVADGDAVDWTDARAKLPASDSGIVDALRAVSRIADVNRALVHGTGDAADGERAQWGHLVLEEKVGEGTFGEIYRAWDARLQREVALKLLR